MYKIYRISRKNNKIYLKNGNKSKLQISLEFNKQWGNKEWTKSADVFITNGKKRVLYWNAEDGNPNGMNFRCFHLDDMLYDERIKDAVKTFRGRNG